MTAPSRSVTRAVLTALIAMTALVPPAAAAPQDEDRAIVLPGATGTEGVASLNGSTFFAGDLLTGDIFRGTRQGSVARFIDAPDGRFAAGMKADNATELLFVAGGPTGQGYVYSTRTGAPVASYQFQTPPTPTFVNDVALTKEGAWFTDSAQALLYFVPVVDGVPSGDFTTLTLSGPAADLSGDFNNNGIQAVRGGEKLIVAHAGTGVLNLVDAATGDSSTIAGVSVPNVDGILLQGGRELYAVQNADNLISVWRLDPDFLAGEQEGTITSPLFQFPTTVARLGGELAVPNAKFDTGFPPTATQYEVVLVRR